jgi:hypothetical protein
MKFSIFLTFGLSVTFAMAASALTENAEDDLAAQTLISRIGERVLNEKSNYEGSK